MPTNHDKHGPNRRRWWTTLFMFPFFQVGPEYYRGPRAMISLIVGIISGTPRPT